MSVLGLGTGLLGQLSDVASAPRRAVWSMLGLPEGGTEAVSQLTGMDPESPWTKALGFGAEIAGDPLNLLGIPLAGRFGKLASRLGPNYQRLLSEADVAKSALPGATAGAVEAARAAEAAQAATAAERMAMANRFQDVMDVGSAAIPQGEEMRMLMERMPRARDAMMATETGPLKNISRLPDDRRRALEALGLATPGGQEAIATLAQPRMMPSGRMSGRHVVEPFHGQDIPFLPPPSDNPAMHGPMGFGPETQSSYLPILQGREEAAMQSLSGAQGQEQTVKDALLRALGGIDQYSIPTLRPWEQAMMMGGVGAMATPVGRELGRR